MVLSTEQMQALLPLSFNGNSDDEHIVMLHGKQAQAMSELIGNDYKYAICQVYQGHYLEIRNTNYKPCNVVKYPSRVDYARAVKNGINKNVTFNDEVKEKSDENPKLKKARAEYKPDKLILDKEETKENLKALDKRISELFPKNKEKICPVNDEAKSKTARNFRKSFRKFSEKMQATVTVQNSIFTTITSDRQWTLQQISNHISTFKRWIKYNYNEIIKCMFVVFEPHASGSWHAHIIFVFSKNISEIQNLNEIEEKICKWWNEKNNKYSDRQVTFRKIDNVVNIINYLDVIHNQKKSKRLKYYPQNAHVLRAYGNYELPITGALSYCEGQRLKKECAGTPIPALSELFIRFTDEGTVLNVSSSCTYYTTEQQISQVASINNINENIEKSLEALKFRAFLRKRIKIIHDNTIDKWFLKFSPYACNYRRNFELYGRYF